MRRFGEHSHAPHTLATKNREICGFTLIELLAVVAIIAIIAGILFPTLRNMSERGKTTTCLSNMRQWGAGLQLYLSDHYGVFPEEGRKLSSIEWENTNVWFNALAEYMGIEPVGFATADGRPIQPRSKSVFMCPSLTMQKVTDELGQPITVGARDTVFAYGYNLWLDHSARKGQHDNSTRFGQFLRMSQILKPARFAVFGEISHTKFDLLSAEYLKYRHNGDNYVNIALADGHVETFYRTNVYVSASESDSKLINRGVIWDPEGIPDQWDPRW